MNITATMVKELRDKTGAGMMDAKKALVEVDGDMEKAMEVLRQKGMASADKKMGRIAAEGRVGSFVSDSCGAMIEVNCETDFVAKNDSFMDFVKACAQTVIEQNPADVDELLTLKAAGSEQTVAELLQEKIQTIGENIKIRRFERMEGACVAYVHAGGKIGVLVNFTTDIAVNDEFIAPYLTEADVPAEVIEHEKEVMRQQVINEGKPEAIADKIVMGKIGKFYKENCLVDQEFVKDNKQTIKQYTNNTAKALGGSIEIAKFVRFEKGEGIEKRQDDFAAEVASMVK